MVNNGFFQLGLGLLAIGAAEAGTVNYRCMVVPPIKHRRSAPNESNEHNTLLARPFTFSVNSEGQLGGVNGQNPDLTIFQSRDTPTNASFEADTTRGQAQILPGMDAVVPGQGSFRMGNLDQGSAATQIQGPTRWHPEQSLMFDGEDTPADLYHHCFNPKTAAPGQPMISYCDAARVNLQNAFVDPQGYVGAGAADLRDYYLYIVTRPHGTLGRSYPTTPWERIVRTVTDPATQATREERMYSDAFGRPNIAFSFVEVETTLGSRITGRRPTMLRSQSLVPVVAGITELNGLGKDDDDISGTTLRCDSEEAPAAAAPAPVTPAPAAAPAPTTPVAAQPAAPAVDPANQL